MEKKTDYSVIKCHGFEVDHALMDEIGCNAEGDGADIFGASHPIHCSTGSGYLSAGAGKTRGPDSTSVCIS